MNRGRSLARWAPIVRGFRREGRLGNSMTKSKKRIEGILSPVVTPVSSATTQPDAEALRAPLQVAAEKKRLLGPRRVRHQQRSETRCPFSEKREIAGGRWSPGGRPRLGAHAGPPGIAPLADSIEDDRAAAAVEPRLAPAYSCSRPSTTKAFFRRGPCTANFAEVIERVGDERLQLYLYHIPPGRSGGHHARPDREAAVQVRKRPVAGVKDSSGNLGTTPKAMLDQFASQGLRRIRGPARISCSPTCATAARACITATGQYQTRGRDRQPVPATGRAAMPIRCRPGISANGAKPGPEEQPMIPALKKAAHRPLRQRSAVGKTCRPPPGPSLNAAFKKKQLIEGP